MDLIKINRPRSRARTFGRGQEETPVTRPQFTRLSAVPAILLFSLACSDSSHLLSNTGAPSSGASPVRLGAADVAINGRSVNDATIPPGSGSSSLFTVTLANPQLRPDVAKIQMDYTEHTAMGMMGNTMSVDCYDDGTHGDAVAGDGTYSYMDTDGHIGPQYQDCVAGQYVYSFHGTDTMGQQTNVVDCRVTVE
jgi:hypothetical protein